MRASLVIMRTCRLDEGWLRSLESPVSDRSETFMPNLVVEHVAPINQDALAPLRRMTHKPRILLLYGSLRERSFSRFAALEAARLLERVGHHHCEHEAGGD